MAFDLGALLGDAVKPKRSLQSRLSKLAREERAAKAQSRTDQGWSKRRPLTRRRMKHDGSTAEQRARRTKNATSPWIPA